MGRKRPEPRRIPRTVTIVDDGGAPLARTGDPDTSHAAADDARRRRNTHCLRMLEAYGAAGQRGCTSDEAGEWSGLRNAGTCWWHRASDLRDRLLITSLDPPIRRMGFSGSSQDVKVITEAGRVVLGMGVLPERRDRSRLRPGRAR